MTTLISSIGSTTIPVMEDPDPIPSQYAGKFVSTYENTGIFTGTIRVFDDTATPEAQTLQQISLVNYSSTVEGFSATQLDATTIQITGTPTNVFPGGMYKFLMSNRSILQSSIIPEEYAALVAWTPPNNKVMITTHTINIAIPLMNQSITATITQEVYWKYQFAISQFREVLSRGTL